MIVRATHALCGGTAVHVVHHRAAAIVHRLLAQSHLADALADLVTLGHRALLQLARTRVECKQLVHLHAQTAAALRRHLASALMLHEVLHLLAVAGLARRAVAR